MKKNIFYFLLMVLMGILPAVAEEGVNISEKYIDYKMEGDRFVIVAVQQDGMTMEDAKQAAMKRAADITLENGYSSFTVVSSSEVTVFQSKPNWPSKSDLPGNLYEEEIQEDNFNRDRTITQDQYATKASQASQIVIECSKKAPKGNFLNPCDYTTCK